MSRWSPTLSVARAFGTPPTNGRGDTAAFELCRFIRADLDRWGHRGHREIVEGSDARALSPQAETGVQEGGLDIIHVVEWEPFESEIVGRACTGQCLPKHAMLGFVPGGLG